jgi:hypothetical protein
MACLPYFNAGVHDEKAAFVEWFVEWFACDELQSLAPCWQGLNWVMLLKLVGYDFVLSSSFIEPSSFLYIILAHTLEDKNLN